MQLLQELVNQHLSSNAEEGSEFSTTQLRYIWEQLSPADAQPDETLYQICEDVFLATVNPAQQAQLQYKPGGWTIKLSESALKTGVVTSLLGGILVGAGITGLPALLIPAVVPLMFEVEKVRLTRSEQEVFAELSWRDEARALTADDLYAKLPMEIQDELSKLDFFDFLEKCRRAGLVEEQKSPQSVVKPVESKFSLRAPEGPRFRITVI
jgi:hypothetical protein